jgi:hypothetical protein
MAADAVAGGTGFAEFGILGPLEVRRSGRAVPLGGPRQRAVLALLLLEANRAVSMDRLAEEVWGGAPPDGWVTTVQTYVFPGFPSNRGDFLIADSCNFTASSDYRTPVHFVPLAFVCVSGQGNPDAPRPGRGRLGLPVLPA